MRNMARFRHGVAGEPIVHSLSPLLASLVRAHLSAVKGNAVPEMKTVAVIPTKGIENALAWGYAGSLPSTPVWEIVGSPLGKFRANTLLQRAVDAAMEHEVADPNLPDAKLPQQVSTPIPKCEEEVWLSITSPLKHQLSAAAVRSVDDAMLIRSVNAMKWDGHSWWAASTDGAGILMVAEAFGHDTSSVLGIVGGGGTARSTAAAWSANGGSIKQMGGRRTLDEEGPWNLVDSDASLVIDFDSGGGDICAPYDKMEGDYDSRIAHLSNVADGRWLLCAQHLLAWARLWLPEHAENLPSLSLLMTRLVEAEVHLA